MREFLASLGIKMEFFLPGVIGAVVALRFFDGLTATQRWTVGVGGWAAANFCTAPLMAWFKLEGNVYGGGIAFALGCVSMAVVAAAIDFVKGPALKDFVAGWLPKKKGG